MTERWSRAEWEEANAFLVSRSGGRCEVCGERLDTLEAPRTVRHHRQRRAIGGDRLSNIILIHGSCHLDVHSHPERSREHGWIVSAYLPDPAEIPMTYQRGERVLLDDAGTLRAA
jgi:5-methylcytosine-specific restriction endonuclease McrA